MAKIKNYDGQTGMELSYVAVQATRPKKKTVDWVGTVSYTHLDVYKRQDR